jgi:tetratricopeptide (TPR) repeat protein
VREAVLVALLVSAATALASGADSRTSFYAGKAAEERKDRKTARAHYQQGIALARAALARDPADPAGLLWLAGNLGGEALTHGKLHALGVIGEIESTLLKLEATHPEYDHAAAARVLGRLYHKAPALISVGSSKKAAHYLGLALARAPDFPGNWAFAADFYESRGDCQRAAPLAVRVLAADLKAHGVDAKEWQEIARDVIDECR